MPLVKTPPHFGQVGFYIMYFCLLDCSTSVFITYSSPLHPPPPLHNTSILHLLSSSPSPTLLPNLPHSLLIPLNPSSILTSTFPFLCPPSLFVLLLLDGLPPRVSRINTIAIPLTVIYYILTTAVILFGVVCIVFNFVYRKRK